MKLIKNDMGGNAATKLEEQKNTIKDESGQVGSTT